MANAVGSSRRRHEHTVAVLRGEEAVEVADQEDAAIFQQHSSRLVAKKSLQLLCESVWCGSVYHPIRSRSDVTCRVMAAVPGEKCGKLFHGLVARFGACSGATRLIHRATQQVTQRVCRESSSGSENVDGQSARIFQFRPYIFCVRSDRRPIFSKSEPHARDGLMGLSATWWMVRSTVQCRRDRAYRSEIRKDR